MYALTDIAERVFSVYALIDTQRVFSVFMHLLTLSVCLVCVCVHLLTLSVCLVCLYTY